MKKEIKTKWLKALRSGEYEQCKKNLRNGDKFCCLGVLTDLYLKETGGNWTEYLKGHSDLVLSNDVTNWAKLDSLNPKVDNGQLAALNDNGEDFKNIADSIEVSL